MDKRTIAFALAGALLGCGAAESAPPTTTTTTETPTTTSTTSDTGTTSSTTTTIELPPLPAVEGPAPFEDVNADPQLVEVNLVARAHTLTLLPGGDTDLLTYNDQLPGPLLHARVGDRVIVHFKNELTDPTTVHWHGLRISDAMDGSPMIQAPIEPGATFTYDFVVPDAGTFWYHTHLHQTEQFERGLYGAIVVHEKDFPRFEHERIFVADDIRLTSSNQVAPFASSGPDVGMGRVGNTLLVNGKAEPTAFSIARGAIERWRFVMATNSLPFGLRVTGGDARVIATDGGLLPAPFALDRVEVAPGQRYDFEVRAKPDATEVLLEALILTVDANNNVVEKPYTIAKATVEGDAATPEPIYPVITLPSTTVTPAESLTWKLSGALVAGKAQFTINGVATMVGDINHSLLHTFAQSTPVKITIQSNVSPAHPFHVHGQFFQIIERGGKPVDEPGLRDTVHVRGQESATILSYFENPGRWMVHCHISEHGERGMMAEIQVGDAASPHPHP